MTSRIGARETRGDQRRAERRPPARTARRQSSLRTCAAIRASSREAPGSSWIDAPRMRRAEHDGRQLRLGRADGVRRESARQESRRVRARACNLRDSLELACGTADGDNVARLKRSGAKKTHRRDNASQCTPSPLLTVPTSSQYVHQGTRRAGCLVGAETRVGAMTARGTLHCPFTKVAPQSSRRRCSRADASNRIVPE